MKRTLYIRTFNPEPWTVGTLSIGRKAGKVFPRLTRDGKLVAFQEGIREDVAEAYPHLDQYPKGTPLLVEFFLWRRRDQYLSPKKRKVTRQRADATNCSKALEDALQGVLYHNDVDNIAVLPALVEQSVDIDPLIIVVVQPWSGASPIPTSDWAWLKTNAPDEDIYLTEEAT